MDIKKFEDIVAQMEQAQQDLEFSCEVQSQLIVDLANATLKAVTDNRHIAQAEDIFNRLRAVDLVIGDCEADIRHCANLLSENPN